MKRLFCVVDRNTGTPVAEGTVHQYFASKQDAKKVRDELNPPLKEDQLEGTAQQYKVSLGPDHGRYNG